MTMTTSLRPPTKSISIGDWIVEWIAYEQGIATTEVDVVRPFWAMNFHTEQMRLLLIDLQDEFAVTIDAVFVWQYSVEMLAAYAARAADMGRIADRDDLQAECGQ